MLPQPDRNEIVLANGKLLQDVVGCFYSRFGEQINERKDRSIRAHEIRALGFVIEQTGYHYSPEEFMKEVLHVGDQDGWKEAQWHSHCAIGQMAIRKLEDLIGLTDDPKQKEIYIENLNTVEDELERANKYHKDSNVGIGVLPGDMIPDWVSEYFKKPQEDK